MAPTCFHRCASIADKGSTTTDLDIADTSIDTSCGSIRQYWYDCKGFQADFTNFVKSLRAGLSSSARMMSVWGTNLLCSGRTEVEGYQCKYCFFYKSFATSGDKAMHEQSHHTEDKPYLCQNCDKRFSRADHRKSHERIHSKEKHYKCDYCDMRFTKSSDKVRHERIHAKEKPYQCRYCSKSFSWMCRKTAHERIHTKEKPYQCEYCSKGFTNSTDKIRHERIHTKEKPYLCRYCSKNFTSSGNRLQHERIIHTKTITYQAGSGSGAYSNKHESTHTDDKTYQCKHCDKSLSTKSNKTAHERIHNTNDKKRYPCNYCDKSFSRSNYRTVHESIHTKEKPYQCKYCDKCFSDPSYRNTHQQIGTCTKKKS